MVVIAAEEIRAYKLFTGLDEAELAEIAGLCQRRNYENSDILFAPENPSEDIFLLESGNDAVQIELPIGTQGEKIVIHTLNKGEAFGWAALGSQHARTAVARCLGPVSVLAINGKNLTQLLEKNNHAGYVVMKNLADAINTRLSYTTIAFRHEMRRLKKTALV
jgi:CRP/FNR family transcriptional regulator, cyclic AMP receptor protein